MSLPLLMILAGGAMLLAALAGGGGTGKRRLARRARALTEARSAPAVQAARLSLRRPGASRLDALAQRILPRPAVLRARLAATGLPITLGHYAVASLAVGVVFGALALAAGAPPILALLAAAADGLLLPHLGVGILMGRRRGRFLKTFAEAIALIVRGLRAGLPVTETVGVVGREIEGPVGEEFRRVADEVRLGAPIEGAMGEAARRIGLPEFDFLAICLAVQRETGGNLAESLENLEHILRRRQQMRLKIKAMSSEATASALIIGVLPFAMAVLMSIASPDYMRVLFTEPLGRLMIAAGLASLAVGGLIMRKMVRFEI